MAWLPLDPALLRIGLYIKIDHGWMAHPFVRDTFTISSPTEISIIRKHRLTKLFYDPVRSHADVIATLADPSLQVNAVEPDAETTQDIEKDEQAMLTEKAVQAAAHDYAVVTNDCAAMFAMANARQPGSLELAIKIVDSMMSQLELESVARSLVCTVRPADAGQELAMQAVNVSALTFLTSKTLSLSQQETQHVGLGALFHNIGQNRVPLSIRSKSGYLLPSEQKLVQMLSAVRQRHLGESPRSPTSRD